jgi:hypothetical protein
MDGENLGDGGTEIVCFGSLGVVDFHRVRSTGDVEDRGVIKVFRELLSVHRSTGDQQLEIRSEACDILQVDK